MNVLLLANVRFTVGQVITLHRLCILQTNTQSSVKYNTANKCHWLDYMSVADRRTFRMLTTFESEVWHTNTPPLKLFSAYIFYA